MKAERDPFSEFKFKNKKIFFEEDGFVPSSDFLASSKNFRTEREMFREKLENLELHGGQTLHVGLTEVEKLRASNGYLEIRNTTLQQELDAANRQIVGLVRRVLKQEKETDGLNHQITRLQGQLREALSSSSNNDSLDPKGYYRALGIDPELARSLSPDKLEELIQGAYRVYTKVIHPDRGGDEERMKQANAAYSFLKNPLNRFGYGRL